MIALPRGTAAIVSVVIVAVAAALRLWRLDLVEFKNDEATALRLAEDLVRHGQLPLVGLGSSVGAQNAAHFIYFLAPWVAIDRDPRFATAAVGIANVLAVAGVIALGWRWFSPLGGVVAGLALATQPWAVFYSRKLWANELLAAWAVLLFAALDQAVVHKKVGWAIATMPIFAVGVLIHFSFGLLGPLVLAPLGMLVMQRRWRELALGVALTVLVSAPYLIHNLQTDWSDVVLLQDQLTVAAAADVDSEGPAFVHSLATTWDTWYLAYIHLDRAVPGRFAAMAANIDTLLVWIGIGVALVAIFFLRGGNRSLEDESRSLKDESRSLEDRSLEDRNRAVPRDFRLRAAGLLLWLALPAVLTTRHAITLYAHYYLFVPPSAALLIGVAVDWFSKRPRRWGRPLVGLAVVGLVGAGSIQAVTVLRMLDFIAGHYDPTYGTPLATTQALANDALGFVAAAGSRHVAIESSRLDNGPLAYHLRPFLPSLELAGVGDIGLAARDGSQPTGRLPGAPTGGSMLGQVQPVDLSYDDGVQVLAVSTSPYWIPGQRLRVAFAWTSVSPKDATLQWDVGLYEASGDRVTSLTGFQHELAGLAPNERVVSWFSFDTEPGGARVPYEVRLRRVDASTRRPVPVLDRMSGAASNAWRSPHIPPVAD